LRTSIHELGNLEHETDLTTLLDGMHEQLHYCPFSLFVLKNLHSADKHLLRTLLSHLSDGLVPSSAKDAEGDHLNPESIGTAMFIFTSDFGTYNSSQSAEEARNEVRVSVRKQFDDELQSCPSNMNKFISKAFLDHVETFHPLSPQELGQVADLELDKIRQRIGKHGSFQELLLLCDKLASNNISVSCQSSQEQAKAADMQAISQQIAALRASRESLGRQFHDEIDVLLSALAHKLLERGRSSV
jgi:ATP-dependent Clp protease ATP-binding subunit ClpA